MAVSTFPGYLNFHTYYRVDRLKSLISKNVHNQHVKFEAIAKEIKFFYCSSHASVTDESTGVPFLITWIVNKRESKARQMVNVTNNLYAMLERDLDSDVLPQRLRELLPEVMARWQVEEISSRNEDARKPQDDTPRMLTLAEALARARVKAPVA
jgi:hypothetical protein